MKKIKILVAEDMKATIKLFDKALDDEMFEKKFAMNGKEALIFYKEWKPDVLVLDVMMPEVSGYKVLEAIRSDKGYNDNEVAIIMVTSKSSVEDVRSCAQFGIEGYIIKPFKMKEFKDQILAGFKKKQLGDQGGVKKD